MARYSLREDPEKFSTQPRNQKTLLCESDFWKWLNLRPRNTHSCRYEREMDVAKSHDCIYPEVTQDFERKRSTKQLTLVNCELG